MKARHAFDASQVAMLRLGRHHLLERQPARLTTVSEDVCGIQAQVMSAAEIALWARIAGLTQAEIDAALWKRRTLVKTACMRGTLHLLSAREFPLYVAAFRRSRVRASLRVMARYGVTEGEAYAVREATMDALAAGPLTRRALTQRVLSRATVSGKARLWFEASWWGVVRQAIVEGLVCYGPAQGQEVCVVRVDQWLAGGRPVDESDAGKRVLRKYLSAYGPATPQDFSKWSGFPMPEVRALWESVGEELEALSVQGRPGFVLRRDLRELANSRSGNDVVRLLPSFDPYMLGHGDTSQVVAPAHYKRVYKGAGWLAPVVLLNGRVVAVWSYARRGSRLCVAVEPLESLSKAVRSGIEAESARLAFFLDLSCEVKFAR